MTLKIVVIELLWFQSFPVEGSLQKYSSAYFPINLSLPYFNDGYECTKHCKVQASSVVFQDFVKEASPESQLYRGSHH